MNKLTVSEELNKKKQKITGHSGSRTEPPAGSSLVWETQPNVNFAKPPSPHFFFSFYQTDPTRMSYIILFHWEKPLKYKIFDKVSQGIYKKNLGPCRRYKKLVNCPTSRPVS